MMKHEELIKDMIEEKERFIWWEQKNLENNLEFVEDCENTLENAESELEEQENTVQKLESQLEILVKSINRSDDGNK